MSRFDFAPTLAAAGLLVLAVASGAAQASPVARDVSGSRFAQSVAGAPARPGHPLDALPSGPRADPGGNAGPAPTGSAPPTVAAPARDVDTRSRIDPGLDRTAGPAQNALSNGGGASLGMLPPPGVSSPPVRSAVPEPKTYLLMFVGIGAIVFIARRNAARQS